jgi:anti-sigma regulatory factor (Ser/Thr protein kinase)
MAEQPCLSEMIRTAVKENLPELLQWVHQRVEQLGLPGRQARQFEVALEEVIVNIVSHAYPHRIGSIALKTVCYPLQRLEVTIVDQGIPFNPLSQPKNEWKKDLEPPVGGLGIVFLRTFVNHIEYKRVGDSNELYLIKEVL